jgi:hypothetical protein
MAIVSRKISSFPQLSEVTGEEYLMVAYKGRTYKLPISVLTGNAITNITQKVGKGDNANNPITITVGNGDQAVNYTFSVYNGSKGSTGDTGAQGPKGVKGDTGVAIYNEDISDLIYNSLEEGELNEEQLSEMILSAAQGVVLNNKLTELEEVYLESQAEYDQLLADGEIKDNVKYFIYEGTE